jgi:hypothetical protein
MRAGSIVLLGLGGEGEIVSALDIDLVLVPGSRRVVQYSLISSWFQQAAEKFEKQIPHRLKSVRDDKYKELQRRS